MNTHLRPIVLVADGIGTREGLTSNVVDDVVKGIESTLKVDAHWVPWVAGYGPVGGTGQSWQANSDDGAIRVLDVIDKNPDRPIILVGYSGGCLVVRKALGRMGHRSDRIVAVALLSDPHRPSDRVQNDIMRPTHGSGVCGGQYVPGFDHLTLWTTHPTDPISNADPDAIIRSLADVSDHLGTDTDAFFKDLGTTLGSRSLQLWRERARFARNPIHWLQTIGDRVGRGIQDVLDYSTRGYHTRGYTVPWADGSSLAHRLGASTSWMARKNMGHV